MTSVVLLYDACLSVLENTCDASITDFSSEVYLLCFAATPGSPGSLIGV